MQSYIVKQKETICPTLVEKKRKAEKYLEITFLVKDKFML